MANEPQANDKTFLKMRSGLVAFGLIIFVYILESLVCIPAILNHPWFKDHMYFNNPDRILWTVEIFVFFILLCCLGIYIKFFQGESEKKSEREPQPSLACNDSPSIIQDPCRMESGRLEASVIVSSPNVPRSIAMDVAKVIMIFVVVLDHTMNGTLGPERQYLVPMSSDVSAEDVLGVLSLPIFFVAMPIFFFISGLYTVSSFNRKGCVHFLFQKLQRLLVPTIIVTYLLYPLVLYLQFIVEDVRERDGYNEWQTILRNTAPKQTWFCVHLLLANVGFAVAWSVKPGAWDVRIRQWFERNLRLDWTLYVWAVGLGLVMTLEFRLLPNGQYFLDRKSSGPWDTFSGRLTYAFLGMYAGYAKWHEQIHAFARATKSEVLQSEQLQKTRKLMKFSLWILIGTWIIFAAITVGVRAGILKEQLALTVSTPSSLFVLDALECIICALGVLASVLLVVYASYRWLDIRPNAFTKFLVRSMYPVFIFHIVVLPCVQMLWLVILRNLFGMTVKYDTSVDSFVGLGQGTLFASFSFILVVTNLIVWPLSYMICRLPLLNRIL